MKSNILVRTFVGIFALLFILSIESIGFADEQTSQNASASPLGLFIEPALTYEAGQTSVSYPSPFGNSTGSAYGLGFGGRVGIHAFGTLFAGIDGRYSRPQFKDSAFNYDATAVSTNWGPVVGVQMPLLGLRAWGSYVLGGVLDPAESNNIDVKFDGASGFRLGAGIHILIVSLNLEYQELKYSGFTLEKLGPFNTNADFSSVKLQNKSWILSASLPLEM
jgi:hypothetical protein